MFGRSMVKGQRGLTGPAGVPGARGLTGPTGPAGPPAPGGSPFKFFTNETTTPKIVDITDADLNKIWVMDLPNAGLDLRLSADLLKTLEQPADSYTWKRVGWVILVRFDSGSGVARLVKPDGTLMANLINQNIQTLAFSRVDSNRSVSVNMITYNNDGFSSTSSFTGNP